MFQKTLKDLVLRALSLGLCSGRITRLTDVAIKAAEPESLQAVIEAECCDFAGPNAKAPNFAFVLVCKETATIVDRLVGQLYALTNQKFPRRTIVHASLCALAEHNDEGLEATFKAITVN